MSLTEGIVLMYTVRSFSGENSKLGGTVESLREAFRLIFGREAGDMEPDDLVAAVAEGFSIGVCGEALARRCLREIDDLVDHLSPENHSWARREIGGSLAR